MRARFLSLIKFERVLDAHFKGLSLFSIYHHNFLTLNHLFGFHHVYLFNSLQTSSHWSALAVIHNLCAGRGGLQVCLFSISTYSHNPSDRSRSSLSSFFYFISLFTGEVFLTCIKPSLKLLIITFPLSLLLFNASLNQTSFSTVSSFLSFLLRSLTS